VLRWNTTPVRLKLARAAIAAMVVVLAGVVMVGAVRHRNAVQLIGVNTAPAVIKAHDIKIWIETLDADTLDELLDPPAEMGSWVSDFDKHRVEIGNHVIEATRNITFGDSELVPIQKIEEALGRYLMAARAARDAHVRGDPAGMLSSYRESYASSSPPRIACTRRTTASSIRSTSSSSCTRATCSGSRCWSG